MIIWLITNIKKVNKMNAEKYLSTIDGEFNDICFDYLNKFIESKELSPEEQKKNLFILLYWDLRSTKETKVEQFYSKTEYKKITQNSEELIFRPIENLVKQNVSVSDFENEIWSIFSSKSFFPDSEAKLGALINLFENPFIPYYQLEEIETIDEEEYYHLRIEILPELRKFLFINRCEFDNPSEQAIYIYDLFKKLADDKKAVVLLSSMIDFYNFRYNSLIKKANINEEDE